MIKVDRNMVQNNKTLYRTSLPLPMASRFMAWFCGCSLSGIAGSKLAGA
jgi:hypothetical protein